MKFIFFIFLVAISAFSQDRIQKVSLQLDWKYQFEYAGYIAAKEKGYYRDAGLDVELREYQDKVDILSDVLNQKVTYGIYSNTLAIENGRIKPIVLLATYLQHSPLIFIAQKGIKTPADMIGKRIMGTKNELKYSSLALLTAHFGITSKNSRLIDHTFNINDFMEKKVDVMSAFRSNELFLLDQKGISYEVIDPVDYGFLMSGGNLFTSPKEAKEHTQRTEEFINATNRGWKYAIEHTDEMIELLIHKYHVPKSREELKYEAYVIKQLMMSDFYPVGSTSSELTHRAFKQLLQTKAIKSDEQLGTFLFSEVKEHSKQGVKLTADQKKYLLQKKTITMCVDPEWYPLEAIREGKHIGMAADVMAHFSKQLSTPIQLVPTSSWSESLENAKHRKCDILSLAASAPERLNYLNFTSSYISVPLVMITTMNKPFIEEIGSLGEEKIGVVEGYATVNKLKAHYPNLQFVEVRSIGDALQKVENGELYGYIDNLLVVTSYIQKEYTGMLKVSSRLEEKDVLSIAVHKDEPILYDIFETMVSGMDRDVMQSIYNRWTPAIEQVAWADRDFIGKTIFVFVFFLIGFIWRYIVLKKYNSRLLELSTTDKLTGLYNRQKTDEVLIQEQKKVNRYRGYHCSIMMIDVDHFKILNDTLGHQAGDDALQHIANILKTNLRETDIIGRWGGEEFIIILPHIAMKEAGVVADNLRHKVETYPFAASHHVTISIGVGEFVSSESVHECVGQVDSALYEAKARGRNQICYVS